MLAWRVALVFLLTIICIFLMGGVAFGIGLLAPTFYLHALWASHCGVEEGQLCLAAHAPMLCCSAQFESLDLVMSLAFFTTDATTAAWGVLADRVGPRRTLAAGVSLSCLSSMLLAISFRAGRERSATAALLLLAASGPGVFTGAFLGSLIFNAGHPQLLTATSSMAAAMMDASALVFSLIDAVCSRELVEPGVVIVCWSLLCALCGLALWWSLRALPHGGAAVATESSSLLPTDTTAAVKLAKEGDGATPSSATATTAAAAPPSVRDTLLSRSNLLLVAYMAALNLPLNFFLQSQSVQVELAFDEDAASGLAEFFSFVFPVVACSSALPISQLLHRADAHLAWGMLALAAHALLALMLVPQLWAQRAAAILFGAVRTLQWAAYFAFLADERLYPESLRGRALGYNTLALAALSDTLPFFLTLLVDRDTWGGSQPGRYAVVKAALQLLFLPASIGFPVWLRQEARRRRCRGKGSPVPT